LLKLGILTEQDRIILGIDPGTTIMGYSLIECQKDEIEILTLGVLVFPGLQSAV
jgi:hypothetical protein